MKIEGQTGTIKIWFGLLKMAVSQGLPINEQFYATWGSREELLQVTFSRWWRERGRALFQRETPKLELIDANDDHLIVQIPTSMSATDVKAKIGRLIAEKRGTKRVSRHQPMAFVGDVKYRTLKQYERLLEVEFDPRNEGKTVEEKTEIFRDVYRRIKVRLDKQKAKLRQTKKRDESGKLISERFRARDPNSFDSDGANRKGIDAKKVSRWRLSGKILLLNVTQGEFPGTDYYGPQLAKKLRKKLEEMGLTKLDGVARNMGGGQLREERTKIKTMKSKRQAEADSLRAYGGVRNPNRWRPAND